MAPVTAAAAATLAAAAAGFGAPQLQRPQRCMIISCCKHGKQLSSMDAALLSLFRRKMSQEVGWDSDKPGYDGLIDLSRSLMSKQDVHDKTVRILRSLFPPFLLPWFRALIAPVAGGKVAAVITARVTQLTCQWLMGPCSVNQVQLSDGTSIPSGVLVEKCKYLEESKCVGVCIHTCKLPTQAFIKEDMAIPLSMEPNFDDLSCQFKFGVEPPALEQDQAIKVPCLPVCTAYPGATTVCPKVSN